MSLIGPRVQEIFKVCLQQKEQCPQVFCFLVTCMPGKIAEQLRQPNTAVAPFQSSMKAGISAKDQQALNAYQDKRRRIAQRVVAEREWSRRRLSVEQQKGLVKQAEIKDANDLKATLLVSPDHSWTMPCNCWCVAFHIGVLSMEQKSTLHIPLLENFTYICFETSFECTSCPVTVFTIRMPTYHVTSFYWFTIAGHCQVDAGGSC